MATPDETPLPPGDRQRFSDPAAEPVYAAIKSLNHATQHQLYEALRIKLHAEDVAVEGSGSTRVALALTALGAAARKLGHSPSVEEYRTLYRQGMRETGWPDDRCIRRWLGSGSWNDALRRAHFEPKPDGDVVVFQHGHFYTVEEMAAALRECAGDLGHPPTYPEYIAWVHRPDVRRRPGRRPASMGVFTRLCEGFLDALRVAGLLPGDPSHAIVSAIGLRRAEYRISDESLKAGICEVARRLGRSPLVAEYIRERRLIYEETQAQGRPRTIASYGTLNRRFGGEWDSILTWAGLEPLGGRATGRRNPNPPKGPRVTKDVIRRALREAYEAEGDPFTTTAYRHWRDEQLEGLGRWQRERYPSYHTIWSRYRTWDAACTDPLGELPA
jgi:hypothetical protein